MDKKITITKLAAYLEMSPSTVSRGLKGDFRIKSETRALIMSTAKELGYYGPQPNNIPFAASHQPIAAQDIVTMKYLARELDIAVSTVSRALSHPDKVAKETVDKVLKAADALGFSINENARNLVARSISKDTSATPTIYTIAQALGLSAATVSRAFSNSASISAKNQKRVFKKAKELNFRPNHDAAMLKSTERKNKPDLDDNAKNDVHHSIHPAPKNVRSRRRLIAVLASSFSTAATQGIMSGIENVMDKFHIQIVMIRLRSEKKNAGPVDFRLLEKLLDGSIYLPTAKNRVAAKYFFGSKPLVSIGSFTEIPNALPIRIDQFTAVLDATSILIGSGCSHVLLVDSGKSADHMRRKNGFQKAHYEKDLAPDTDQILHLNEQAHYMKQVLAHLKKNARRYDGLVLIDFVPEDADLRQFQVFNISANHIAVIEMEVGSAGLKQAATFHQVYCSYEEMGRCGAKFMIGQFGLKSDTCTYTDLPAIISPAIPESYLRLVVP